MRLLRMSLLFSFWCISSYGFMLSTVLNRSIQPKYCKAKVQFFLAVNKVENKDSQQLVKIIQRTEELLDKNRVYENEAKLLEYVTVIPFSDLKVSCTVTFHHTTDVAKSLVQSTTRPVTRF